MGIFCILRAVFILISGKILQKLLTDDGQFLFYAERPYVLNQNCRTLFYLLFTNSEQHQFEKKENVYLTNSAQCIKG